MQVSQQDDNRYLIYLTEQDYDTLLDHCERIEHEIAVRLGGEVGLKVREMTNVELSHVSQYDHPTFDGYFLTVPEFGEEAVREHGRPRDAYLPKPVLGLMKEFAGREQRDYNEPLFSVTKRTVQEYVKKPAEAVAEYLDKPDFAKISSSDLRVFFAKNMIERKHVNPEVVMSVGGWNSYQSLSKYFDDVTKEVVVTEFQRAGF